MFYKLREEYRVGQVSGPGQCGGWGGPGQWAGSVWGVSVGGWSGLGQCGGWRLCCGMISHSLCS